MQLTYDSKYNVAYIAFRDKTDQVQTIKVSDSLNVDLAPDGTVFGIELLNAREQLMAQNNGNLVFVNSTQGDRQEISLQA